MTFNKDVVEAIGNTPLIKLKRASEATGCTILGKAEFMWMILPRSTFGSWAGSNWKRSPLEMNIVPSGAKAIRSEK